MIERETYNVMNIFIRGFIYLLLISLVAIAIIGGIFLAGWSIGLAVPDPLSAEETIKQSKVCSDAKMGVKYTNSGDNGSGQIVSVQCIVNPEVK